MLNKTLKIRKIKNKKAMFFTLIAIAILFLFLVSYTFYSVVQDRKSVQKRILTMNNFVYSLEQDMPRQLYTSGFRIIFLMENHILETGEYITGFDAAFNELFYNATLYEETDEQIESLMEEATFSGIQENVNNKGGKINIDVSLTEPEIFVSQDDPWNIKLNLTAKLLIEDKADLALWNKTTNIVTYIPIQNFEDPLYIVGTNGSVTNHINQTPYDVPIPSDNLLNHVSNSYYIANTDAPSFLDRLQGNLEPDSNGIESLVHLPTLSAQGIPTKDKSCVDYIYFSSNNPLASTIAGMPSWFKLDEPHKTLYGV